MRFNLRCVNYLYQVHYAIGFDVRCLRDNDEFFKESNLAYRLSLHCLLHDPVCTAAKAH